MIAVSVAVKDHRKKKKKQSKKNPSLLFREFTGTARDEETLKGRCLLLDPTI